MSPEDIDAAVKPVLDALDQAEFADARSAIASLRERVVGAPALIDTQATKKHEPENGADAPTAGVNHHRDHSKRIPSGAATIHTGPSSITPMPTFPEAFYRWRPHPWHGLALGPEPPRVVHAYIEITPFDLVKYEVDKATGYMRVDRPQRSSSQPPALYGFIPRTYCDREVVALSPNAKSGDGDPLDICVLSERPINRAEVILNAKVVGGLQVIDHGEADDKIIAVLLNDNVWGGAEELSDLPPVLVERLRHYFGTYKLVPGREQSIHIESVYSRDHALNVIRAAVRDYERCFGE